MRNMRRKALIVAAGMALSGVGLWTSDPAFGRDRDRDEDRRESREDKEARKRERREYERMPKDARKAIKRAVEDAEDNVDYFTTDQDGREVYGARYTNRAGRQLEIRVNEDGDVLHQGEVAAAAAPAPAAAEAQPAAAAAESREPQEVAPDQVPEAARRTIEQEVAGAKDVHIYRLFEQGTTSYHATYTTPKGDNLRLYVAEDGKVLSLRNERSEPVATVSGQKAIEDDSVELSELPGPAQEQLRRLTEGSTNVRLYRAMFGKRPCYQAIFTNRQGQYVSVRVADNGEVLQTKVLEEARRPAEADRDPRDASVTAADLPEAVRATVERETRGARNVRLYRAKLGNQDVINARFRTADGRDMSIRIDNSGRVVESKQLNEDEVPAQDPDDASLTLEQIPSAARATIERESRGGKRVRYYRAKLGKQDVTEAEWTNDAGKRISLRVDESGKVVDRKEQ